MITARTDLAQGVFTFRDPDLYQLQRAKAADWNVLRSGGEDVSQEEFRGLMCKLQQAKSGNATLSDKEESKVKAVYLKDRENAEQLGMTHPQYMAVKYQAESLIPSLNSRNRRRVRSLVWQFVRPVGVSQGLLRTSNAP